MHGQISHAPLAWTSGFGFFKKDQSRRTPSRWSMILLRKRKRRRVRENREREGSEKREREPQREGERERK